MSKLILSSSIAMCGLLLVGTVLSETKEAVTDTNKQEHTSQTMDLQDTIKQITYTIGSSIATATKTLAQKTGVTDVADSLVEFGQDVKQDMRDDLLDEFDTIHTIANKAVSMLSHTTTTITNQLNTHAKTVHSHVTQGVNTATAKAQQGLELAKKLTKDLIQATYQTVHKHQTSHTKEKST